MRSRYRLWMTGRERGAMASLTAFPTADYVCVVSNQLLFCHLQYFNSLVNPGALSSCCCCYVYGWNMRRLNHLETQGVPLREPFEMRTGPDCEGHCSLGKTAPVLQVRLSFPSP
jgi:hypothetical protein